MAINRHAIIQFPVNLHADHVHEIQQQYCESIN